MIKKTIYILLTFFLFVACQNEETENLLGNSPVEVNARISDLSRVSLADNDFDSGDSFILYEGTPNSNNTSKSEYKYDGNSWSGAPGLFWDNLKVWNSGILISDATLFTAVLGDPILSASDAPNKDKASFTVAKDQNVTEEQYLKNDILVAYGSANVSNTTNRKLSLAFSHIFARLKIKITEADSEGTLDILSEETTVSLSGIKIGSTITFDADDTKTIPSEKVTDVEADGNSENVILHKCGSSNRTFSYEAIIPSQSLATGITLTISNNENGKVYNYNLSDANITISGATDKDDLLQQGHLTTLSLQIKKTGATITASVASWGKTTSSGVGTPTDYPIIEIGKGDEIGGGDDDGGGSKEDDYAGKTIQLTEDIDDPSKLGLPLGSRKTPFRGTFDGQGHTIRNIVLNNTPKGDGDNDGKDDNPLSGLDFLGVFGYTDGATIKNLNIEIVEITNVSMNSSTATGGLAGYINNTLIENCHVTVVSADAGGKSITASYNNAGGLVGYVNGASTIKKCSANATVKSQDYAGGLIGQSQSNLSLTQCFAKGNVEAVGYYAGGLMGHTLEGEITFSYSWASVKASRYSGGLIGRTNSTTISNCYAAGTKVEGAISAGLIGYTNVAVKNCYWNVSCNSNTKGVTGISLDSSCSSFAPTEAEAAMGTVLNGLNLVGTTLTGNWELATANDYKKYALPILVNNKGDAKESTE